jgi:hypothetical protein
MISHFTKSLPSQNKSLRALLDSAVAKNYGIPEQETETVILASGDRRPPEPHPWGTPTPIRHSIVYPPMKLTYR